MVKNIFKNKFIDILLILGIIIASTIKIYVGIDCDENYIVTLGMRFLQGDHLFKEIWDLYQTGALPIVFFMSIYKQFNSNLVGLVVYLRVITTVIQFLTAIMVYNVLKPYYKNVKYVGMIIAVLSIRGLQNFDYVYCSFFGLLICIVLVYYVVNNINRFSSLKVIVISTLAGAFLSESVLAYPTFALTVIPILIYLFLESKKDKRINIVSIVLVSTCIILAVLFLLFVLSNVSFGEMLNNFMFGMLGDESHSSGNMLTGFIYSLFKIRKDQLFVGAAIILVSGVTYFILHRIKCKANMFICILLVSSFMFVLLNLTGIRYSGPLGMSIRYALLALASIQIYKHSKNNRDIVWLFGCVGIIVFIAALIGTNLGIAETAPFFLILIMGTIILMGEDNTRYNKLFEHLAIVAFIVSLIVTKGFVVRVTGLGPANILENRKCISFGVLNGIYDYPQNVDEAESIKSFIENSTSKDDIVLIMSREPLYNTFVKGKFTSLSTIPTVKYTNRWVKYYKDYDYAFPTKIIVIKKDNGSWDEITKENVLIKYFFNYIKSDSIKETELMYLVDIMDKNSIYIK